MPTLHKNTQISGDAITSIHPKEKNNGVKNFFVGIGTYLLFVIIVTVINSFLLGPYSSGTMLLVLVRVAVEVQIFSLIASIFIKGKDKGLKPLVVGTILSAILYLPDLYFAISDYNLKREMYVSLANSTDESLRALAGIGSQTYSVSIYEYLIKWFFESDYSALFLNTIFFFNFKKGILNNKKWSEIIGMIWRGFLPLIIILSIITLLVLAVPEVSGVLIAFILPLVGIIALVRRFSEKALSKQIESVNEGKPKLKYLIVIIFGLFGVASIYGLFTSMVEDLIITLPLAITFFVASYLMYKESMKGTVWAYIAVGLKAFERTIVTLADGDYVGFFFMVLVCTCLILLINNYKKVYSERVRQGNTSMKSDKTLTINEKLENAFVSETEESNIEEDFLETAEMLRNSIKYKYAQQVLRDIAIDQTETFTEYFEKAQKRIGTNPFEVLFRKLDTNREIEIKPDELRPRIRKLRDNSFIVILKLPEPDIYSEPLFIALKFEPNMKYYTLELTKEGRYSLCYWEKNKHNRLKHVVTGNTLEPELESFYWSISDLY